MLKAQFRPEFLNRIDDIVFYKPLAREEIYRITDLLLADIRRRLKEKRLDVELTEAAKRYIADAGYSPQYGARPLKRLLAGKLETLLARSIIQSDPEPDTVFMVDESSGELIITEK